MDSIGKVIKDALKRRGMTQQELADELFVTQQTVSKWVNDKSLPDFEKIADINNILGVDLVQKIIRKDNGNYNHMKHLDLHELSSYDVAQKEAESILSEARIDANYSHSVYMLCRWLVTAVIGLTYHQMIHNKDEDDEYRYEDIFSNLEDYIDDELLEKDKGLYENYLERSFYLMGGDLFESFDEYKMVNHDYCRESMNEWYKFKKAIKKSAASPIYNELLVAVTEIINY